MSGPPEAQTQPDPGSVPQQATHPNHVWTYDFVFDTTSDSRTLKSLTLVDEFTRECLAIKVERRLPAKAVIEVLEQVFAERGVPKYLRSDNGPEFIAQAVQMWLKQRQVKAYYIEPGSPWQNACGESFNGKFRDECLNMEVFYSLAEATTIVQSWRHSYNCERPHSSLGYQTPAEFAASWRLLSGTMEQSPQVAGADKVNMSVVPAQPENVRTVGAMDRRAD
jgi:putative transposase